MTFKASRLKASPPLRVGVRGGGHTPPGQGGDRVGGVWPPGRWVVVHGFD